VRIKALWGKLYRFSGIDLFCSMNGKMKRTGIITLLLFCMGCCGAQTIADFGSGTRIYIVRHAEKYTGKDAGKDPFLTSAGYERAGELMRVLKNKGISRIYVSQYRRTQLTADSLRIVLGIDTVHYQADTLCDDLMKRILNKGDMGGRILIVAHSNTIPYIIRKLGLTDIPAIEIADNEYDNLFLVKKKRKRLVLARSRYGRPLEGLPSPMK